MPQYNSYHSVVKTSYALGLEEQLLPQTFINQLPRSTTQGWRTIDPNDFVGSQFANQVETDLEHLQLLLDRRLKKMRTAFYAFSRLYLNCLDWIGKNNFQKLILQNKEAVIDLVEHLPIEWKRNLICKFLGISLHQFKLWKNNRRFNCALSLIGYCIKRFPTQISQKEINVLKSFMSRKRFVSWSIASIWGYAFKKGFISMSRTSWYRYCLKLEISKKRKTKKKERKRISIKATCPNEIWHMDVTEFVTKDNIKYYIHTVLDNFSRKVIAYTVSRDKTAKTRLISLKEAIKSQFESVLSKKELDLIVDGGGENNNVRIHNFIRHSQVNIHKKIALKQVHFSNSMIEGHFKMLKTYLRNYGEIHSTKLATIIALFVKDHNQNKPIYSYQIHTPNEVHSNPNLVHIKPVLEKANKDRLDYNRNFCCKQN